MKTIPARLHSLLLFFIALFSFSTLSFHSFASESRRSVVLEWGPNISIKQPDGSMRHYLNFEGASFGPANDWLPEFSANYPLTERGDVKVEIENLVFVPLNDPDVKPAQNITGADIRLNSGICYQNKLPFACVRFIPIRYNNFTGNFEKLLSFDLKITVTPVMAKSGSSKTWVANSVLRTGNWYKIGVVSTGIHKISRDFLKDMGINTDAVSPESIKIYGNGNGMIPHSNATPRYDDLTENAIAVVNNGGGNFDADDYILFYGQAAVTWRYDAGDGRFHHQVNYFSDTTYYFLTFGGGPGKRIATQASSSLTPNQTVTSFDEYAYHELEQNSLIKSGREWYGEEFDKVLSHSFTIDIPDLASNTAYFQTQVVARSLNAQTSFNITVGGSQVPYPPIPKLWRADYTDDYVYTPTSWSGTVNLSSGIIPINYSYNQNSGSIGWLNYFELNARRKLAMSGNQMAFRDALSVASGNVSQFVLDPRGKDVKIWDVTDPIEAKLQQTINNGGMLQFTAATPSLREFIAYDGQNFITPSSGSAIGNQNLHNLSQADMIIVSPPEFLSDAQALADFHAGAQGLKTHVVTPAAIYNEFSSGAQDIAAIRDFMKMFYDRSTSVNDEPKYLLLFGDASYDFKYRVSGNTNFVPSYQSQNSYSPSYSYVSDDFFGLLDDSEGDWNAFELLDIGIGRIPVKNPTEARQMVDKIKHYASRNSFGEWRNEVMFIGDDDDGNMHMNQANQLATYVDTTYEDYHVQKLFFDAYPMQSTAGGNRYPDVNRIINETVDKGALIINYTGHGGEAGLAHEKVLGIQDIESWTNYDNMPIFVTATCEFSKFDDPGRTSAGELVLLNSKGGGIALLTTVRLVYAGPNFDLNKAFYVNNVFQVPNANKPPTLGDIMKITKNNGGTSENSRNFTLLGDPALALAYPRYNVNTTTIKGKAVSTVADTLRALEKVTITGTITDDNGQVVTSFNGIVYPTVFDKPTPFKTLPNNPKWDVATYSVQKNVIYKGRASVTNGVFTFTFVVPKDISYQLGYGKISYYAENGVTDANGQYDNIVIGGTATNVSMDTKGPEIVLTMNDDRFVFGGTTDENPLMIAKVTDENGINTVGNGIGHEITAVLDDNTENVIILNNYYQAALDNHMQGEIKFRFSKLAPGPHKLKVKVWDVYNNSAEAYTEFVVANSSQVVIDHLLNYPNPFTSNTTFHFDHNQPGQPLQVQVQILTVGGKIVKTLNSDIIASGSHFSDLKWDGLDEFGDKISNGVYVYKVKLKAPNGTHTEKIEKLVILN
jgi:hypothetical protein